MHRRPSARLLALLAAAAMLGTSLAVPAGAGAVEPTIEILYAPSNPLVANSPYGFTAKLEPSIDDATVEWTVSGALFATDLSNPNGVSQVSLAFGPGGYSVVATLVGTDAYAYAVSETLLVLVDPDPAKLPDRFSLAVQGQATEAASGEDVRVTHLDPVWPQNRLNAHAESLATDDDMGISLLGPDGVPLVEGVYNPADTPRQATSGAEGAVGGCDNGASTGGFAVLNLDRGAGGFPIGFTLLAEYTCANHLWPRVGWIRYNDTTPIPSLSLPNASPEFDAVVEGQRGAPVAFPFTNDGEVPVTLGAISLTGTNAAAWELGDDTCSGETLDPGEGCSFELRFAPATAGSRTATIVIPSDLPVGPRRLRIVGQSLIATSVSAPVVSAETEALAHGVRFAGTVTPPTERNTVVCELDGEDIAGSGMGPGGGAFCLAERPADGDHEVRMRYVGSHVDGPSVSPVTAFTVDGTTGTGMEVSDDGAQANVPVVVTATVGFAGDLAYPGGILTIVDQTTDETLASGPVGPGDPSVAVTRTFSQGPHHLVASYAGIDGVQAPSSASADLAILEPDLSAPTVAAPVLRLRQGQTVVDGRVPVRLLWAGGDTGSGIDHVQVRRQVDGGAWTQVRSALADTTLDLLLAPGRRYRYAVRAVDRAGNLSPWVNGAPFELVGVPERHAAVGYQGRWRVVAAADAWGGGVARTREQGATATLRVAGTSIGWVSTFGPGRGVARIFVDGVLRETVDLDAPSIEPRRLAWVGRWSSGGTRTIRIRVTSPDGERVDVDGFVVLR